MTLPAGNRAIRSAERAARRGFTLIELILVMSIMIIVISVIGPSLTSFFRGQTLDAESRRFLALTRYAQSRAVAEGVPMTLWIDAKQRSYGLEIEAGFADRDDQAKEFLMEKDLEIEVTAPLTTPTPGAPGATMASANANELKIRFTPDGFISEANPEAIIIREGGKDEVWITPNRNRLNYEINTDNQPVARR